MTSLRKTNVQDAGGGVVEPDLLEQRRDHTQPGIREISQDPMIRIRMFLVFRIHQNQVKWPDKSTRSYFMLDFVSDI